MYSLTFCIHVITPLQYGRNGTALLQITSRVQQARQFYHWRGESSPACIVRAAWWAWRITAGLCHAFLRLPQQRNPCTNCKYAQQCTTRGHPYQSPKLHLGPCNSIGMRPLTDTQARVTTIHFASSMIHAKCNNSNREAGGK